MRQSNLPYGCLVLVALLVVPAPAAAAVCDTSGTGGYELGFALDAIDATCPCTPGQKTGARAQCAKTVIAARVGDGLLAETCKKEALGHVKKAICNRPGAVVCCHVKTGGKAAHKIARDASKCIATPKISACVSVFPSVPRGCNATGCIAPVCGNGTIEPGESCDPPNAGVCDAACQIVPCYPPVTTCGNGTLEGGEACEPPGVGACSWTCQPAPCAAPEPGEIAVACLAGQATVGAGSQGSDYLLAWSGLTYRPDTDIVARRFDADGAPLDPTARVVSTGVPCGGAETRPAIGATSAGYVIAWGGFGPVLEAPGAYYSALYARPYDNAATLGPLDELARAIPFGMCAQTVSGPTAIAPIPLAGPQTFATLWQDFAACVFGPSYRDPTGVLLDYTGDPPTRTSLAIGYALSAPPTNASLSAATVASLPGDTLAAWHAHFIPSPSSSPSPFVAGAWLAADGMTTAITLSSRPPGIGSLRPTVAAATDRFLVAWAQGPVTDATEIRAMRVTHASGPLDPDGGLLLATTAGGAVRGGPVAAFDGNVWLVAWTEVGGGGNDLRAVAVQPDGTLVDATPRLLASGLSDAEPAIASKGDGRSLVIYVRPDAGASAVRAQVVPGT